MKSVLAKRPRSTENRTCDVDNTKIAQLNAEILRLTALLGAKDDLIRSKNETIGALSIALKVAPGELGERGKLAADEGAVNAKPRPGLFDRFGRWLRGKSE